MKRTKKTLYTLWMLVLAFVMAGCGFSVGKKDNDILGKKYEDIFDSEEAQHNRTHIMRKYNVTTTKFGEMVVIMDESKGHRFEMDKSGDFYTIYDRDDEEVVVTHFLELNVYQNTTAVMDDSEIMTINHRDFFVRKTDVGYIALSYMADCGLDLAICMQADYLDDFWYVAYDGEPIPGSSSDIHYYQGKKAPEPEPEPEPVPDPEPEPDPVTVPPSVVEIPAGENFITYENGESFKVTQYDVTDIGNNVYQLADDMGVIEAHSYVGVSKSALTEAIQTNLKEDSGVTPVVDIHSEGDYITGIYSNQMVCAFITESNGCGYTLILYSYQTDDIITIANSLIDDLLASDFVDGVRTQYGEPVE